MTEVWLSMATGCSEETGGEGAVEVSPSVSGNGASMSRAVSEE